MCSPRTIEWIYRRPWLLTPTTTPRPTACWSPGTSSTTSSHSTGRRALRQDSMLHYWPGRASIWHNPIFVLLLLLIFLFLYFFTSLLIFLVIITILCYSLVSYLLHYTRLCPIVMVILTTTTLFFFVLFRLCYDYLGKLACDHTIVWLPFCIFTCVPVSVNYSLMKAAVGCRNVWITVSVFWLAQRIDQYSSDMMSYRLIATEQITKRFVTDEDLRVHKSYMSITVLLCVRSRINCSPYSSQRQSNLLIMPPVTTSPGVG